MLELGGLTDRLTTKDAARVEEPADGVDKEISMESSRAVVDDKVTAGRRS